MVGLYGLVIDRTEQHHATARIEDSERQLRAVTDNLPVLITYVDAAEKIKFLNGTFRDWLGVDLDDAIGRPIGEVIGPVNYLQRQDQIRTALAGERVEFEVVSQTLAGIRDLQTVYIPDTRSDGRVHGIFTLSTDVTALKKVEKQLSALARVDSLTGLPNRRQFEERLEESLARSKRTRRPMAVIFLDVDHFKSINDTHGHGFGDGVLREFARRLQEAIRKTDLAARLAGDEFVVILEGLNIVEEAAAVARKLIDSIRIPIVLGDRSVSVTTSMGIAYRDGDVDDSTAQELLDGADRALYRAKAQGRDSFDLEPAHR